MTPSISRRYHIERIEDAHQHIEFQDSKLWHPPPQYDHRYPNYPGWALIPRKDSLFLPAIDTRIFKMSCKEDDTVSSHIFPSRDHTACLTYPAQYRNLLLLSFWIRHQETNREHTSLESLLISGNVMSLTNDPTYTMERTRPCTFAQHHLLSELLVPPIRLRVRVR